MKRYFYQSAVTVIFILLFSGWSFAADRYVNGTTGNDITGDGTVGNPWQTIQHAIDNSSDNDVIHVAAGTYTEDLAIPSGLDNLEIVGAGTGSSIIQGVDRLAYTLFPLADPNIEILGDGTAIHDFTIKNPSWVDGFYSSGMVIGAMYVEIYDNEFLVAGSDDTDDVSQGLQTYATLDISELYIHNNDFSDLSSSTAGYEGIYINKNVGVGEILISYNSFTGDILRAITTEASNTVIVVNSITTDLAPGLPGGYQGINIAYPAGSGTVSSVWVCENVIEGATVADGFQYGISVGNGAGTNTFTGIQIWGNDINGNQVGIRIREDAAEMAIYNNSLTSNSSFYVKNDDAGTVPVSCNWWGTTDAATIATLISGSSYYKPYLSDGTDVDPVSLGFQPLVSCCDDVPSYNFEVTPTNVGWTTNSKTLISDECIIYKVNCAIGEAYTFKTGCGNGATADFDSYLEVFDADGDWFLSNDDGCSDYRSTVTWTATEATAYVKVRGYNSLNYGDYTLAYIYDAPAAVTCQTPPSFDATVTPLVAGTWYTDAQTIGSDECYIYKVNTTVGKTYTFKTGCGNGATADFDTYIDVYDAAGTWFGGNDDGCSEYRSTFSWTATETSAYVKVRGYNSAKFGDYTVACKFDDPAPTGTCQTPPLFDDEITALDWIALGQGNWGTDAQTLASEECYIYKVNLTVGKAYTFKTGCGNGATADFDSYIDVYNASGTWFGGNDDGCSDYRSTYTWTATEATAYVKVRGYNSANYGDYTVAFMFDDPAAPSGTCQTPPLYDEEITALDWIGIGEGNWGTDAQTLASAECYIYKVTLTVGKAYTFKTGCGDGATADFDTYIDVYDAAGTWFGGNDDGCSDYRSTYSWTASEATAYVKVRGWNTASYGDYTVAFMFEDPAPVLCATPPAFDEALPAPTLLWQTDGPTSIVSTECYIYKVAVTDGDDFTFMTGCTEGSTDFDTFLELYDADGVWLAQNDDGCAVPSSGDYSSKLEWTGTYSGFAYLLVRGWSTGSFGDFTVAFKYVAGGPDLPLGTENEPDKNVVKVYPNPANQSFLVTASLKTSFTSLVLNEFTGKVVKEWKFDQPSSTFRVDCTDLAPGVYVLSVETPQGWSREKISVIR